MESQGLGHTVAYCGDGINDIAALHAADLGIAIGATDAIVAAPVFTPAESATGLLPCPALPYPALPYFALPCHVQGVMKSNVAAPIFTSAESATGLLPCPALPCPALPYLLNCLAESVIGIFCLLKGTVYGSMSQHYVHSTLAMYMFGYPNMAPAELDPYKQ